MEFDFFRGRADAQAFVSCARILLRANHPLEKRLVFCFFDESGKGPDVRTFWA
jgi:hypothetical protein